MSVVFCEDTETAKLVLNGSKWLMDFENTDIRVVSDMVRKEENNWNYTAGVDLLKFLYNENNFPLKSYLFVGDVKRATDSCT